MPRPARQERSRDSLTRLKPHLTLGDLHRAYSPVLRVSSAENASFLCVAPSLIRTFNSARNPEFANARNKTVTRLSKEIRITKIALNHNIVKRKPALKLRVAQRAIEENTRHA